MRITCIETNCRKACVPNKPRCPEHQRIKQREYDARRQRNLKAQGMTSDRHKNRVATIRPRLARPFKPRFDYTELVHAIQLAATLVVGYRHGVGDRAYALGVENGKMMRVDEEDPTEVAYAKLRREVRKHPPTRRRTDDELTITVG